MRLFRKDKVLCSIGAGPHEELMALASPGFARYAKLHGYDVVLEKRLLETSRPASWSKVLLIQRLIPRYRNVVWIDCDTVIVDPSKDILEEMPREAMLGLVAHKTPEGDQIPNMGVFAVRSNRHASAFFEQVWRRTEFIHHKWWENGAVLALLGYTTEAPIRRVSASAYQKHVQFLEGGWNSLSIAPATHPRIIHFAGQTHEVRVAEMSRLAARQL